MVSEIQRINQILRTVTDTQKKSKNTRNKEEILKISQKKFGHMQRKEQSLQNFKGKIDIQPTYSFTI